MYNKNKINDKYFSDDELDNDEYMEDGEDEENVEDGEDGEDIEEYEIDEETRRIIFEHANRNFEEEKTINNDEIVKQIKQKNKIVLKQNKKQIFSLNEFNKKVEQDIIARKPKKFMSKRVGDKKNQLGMQNEPIIKRSFNPRNQPFNFVKSNDINIKLDILNLEDFPSL
jgi:hypothetical protein